MKHIFKPGHKDTRKYWESFKIEWKQGLRPSILSRIKTLALAVDQYAKADINVLCSCAILFEFFTLIQIFCQAL